MEAGIVMAFFLFLAVYNDIRTLKIPNFISIGGAVTGIVVFMISGDTQMVISGLAGWATGLIVMLPFYSLRVMGAGDVKLIAMTGVYLGLPSILGSIAVILVSGGIFSVIAAITNGKLTEAFENIRHFAMHSMLPGVSGSIRNAVEMTPVSGKLPYSVPIMAGTLIWLLI